MPRYFIQAPHSPEECAGTLRTLLQQGPGALVQFDFACAVADSSNHVGVAILEAKSEALVLEAVPEQIRDRAVAVEVRKVMPEEVRLLSRSS